MRLYSTNDPENKVNFRTALLDAFPKDRGLYMPERIPKLHPDFLKSISKQSFPDIALHVLSQYLSDEIPVSELEKIVTKAFDFPLVFKKLHEKLAILELFHGPSLAFKDFGARFMAGVMSWYLKELQEKRTILVATSGDTGGAVASGFYGHDNIEVIILYPARKVSPLQEKQLTSWGGNIRAIEIDGVFDDCQSLVKQAFLDEELKKKYCFSSANSINIARLLPQSLYYFEAYKQASIHSENISVIVPSGNFGNITAGLLAKEMGLPLKHLVAACNLNKPVVDYLQTGEFTPRRSIQTISNAMDVGNPSNFPRIKHLFGSTWNIIKENMKAFSYSDKQTSECMNEVLHEYDYLMDPHGAVGYCAYLDYSQQFEVYCVILETAHPSKFNDVIEPIINQKVKIPNSLLSFSTKDKQSIPCSKQYEDFKDLLMFA